MTARRIKPPHDPEADERVRQLNKRQITSWFFPDGSRTYFRFSDGRLGSMPNDGMGMRVELDDPYTAKTYLDKMRDLSERYQLVNGVPVLTKRGQELKEQERLEREFKKTQPPEWFDASYFEPTNTGVYLCEVKVGLFRKRIEEQKIYFKSGIFRGKWLTPFTARVVKWQDKRLK
jgi:hypothetical protein